MQCTYLQRRAVHCWEVGQAGCDARLKRHAHDPSRRCTGGATARGPSLCSSVALDSRVDQPREPAGPGKGRLAQRQVTRARGKTASLHPLQATAIVQAAVAVPWGTHPQCILHARQAAGACASSPPASVKPYGACQAEEAIGYLGGTGGRLVAGWHSAFVARPQPQPCVGPAQRPCAQRRAPAP